MKVLLKLKDLLDSLIDKIAHYGIGLTVGMILSFWQSNDIWGYVAITLIVILIGVFKEAFDVVCGKVFNWKDVLATAIGGVVFCIYWNLIK